jgi:hypothetical protein
VASVDLRVAFEELLGRSMLELYPGIEGTEMFGHLQRCMRDRISHSMDNEFVYAEPGHGSTFKLYFTRVLASADRSPAAAIGSARVARQ